MKTLIICALFFCQCATAQSLPLKNLKINSGFGLRIHPITGEWKIHQGIDLAARHDTVYSILDGIIERVAFDERLGLNVKIRHNEDLETVYGHLSAFYRLTGDTVRSGDAIGLTGATGIVTGEHLHFAVRYKNQFINPLAYLYGLFKNQTP
jgi:murein DD-endopeptidase MepM/ murein hydrolase activator NlpD